MGGSVSQLVLLVLAGGTLGAVAGALIGAAISNRRSGELCNSLRRELDDVTHQRDEAVTRFLRSKSTISTMERAVTDGRARLQSARKQSVLLKKHVLALRAERENTKIKLSTMQNSLISVKQQTVALQMEFDRASEFYKGELVKSFDKRKLLEKELENARSEQESFARLVESSVLEHGSPEEMITAAQLRLGQLDVLQRNVNKLEAENAELSAAATRTKRDYETLERDLAELHELRINNKQLVRCVEALESSRKQHEDEAARYREQADQSDQLSDTLRLKLDDLEKNFADMETQQDEAIKHVREAAVIPTQSANDSRPQSTDEGQDVVELAKYSKHH